MTRNSHTVYKVQLTLPNIHIMRSTSPVTNARVYGVHRVHICRPGGGTSLIYTTHDLEALQMIKISPGGGGNAAYENAACWLRWSPAAHGALVPRQ